MDREIYHNAEGFVVNYKAPNEPLLFNELHGRCGGLGLLDRGKDSAAFSADDYAEVAEEAHREDFVFLQHIHPFMYRSEISGDTSDFQEYIRMLGETVIYAGEGDSLICQCRIAAGRTLGYSNGELTDLLASYLEREGYPMSVQEADAVISLTVFDRSAYMGISLPDDNVSLRTGGVLFYAKAEDMVCRAEFKIEEAFGVFGIRAESGMKALDLGAAPGGWTHYLSMKGIAVDAVDPAALDEAVLERDNVRHFRMTAQEFAREQGEEEYDIIVNDMKMDTNQSIDIVCDMSSQLKKEGICLMTLKLPKQGIQKRINVARKVLGEKFETVRIRQLYYNRSEVTVYMKGRR